MSVIINLFYIIYIIYLTLNNNISVEFYFKEM